MEFKTAGASSPDMDGRENKKSPWTSTFTFHVEPAVVVNLLYVKALCGEDDIA